MGVVEWFFKNEIYEIESGFDSNTYTFFKGPSGPEFAESFQGTAGWSFGVASDIMYFYSKEMT